MSNVSSHNITDTLSAVSHSVFEVEIVMLKQRDSY